MASMTILFYLLLIDAILAVSLAFSGKQNWWQVHLGAWARHFPLARGWCLYYLVLVLLFGYALHKAALLALPF